MALSFILTFANACFMRFRKHGRICLLDSENRFYMLDNTILTVFCTCYLCKHWRRLCDTLGLAQPAQKLRLVPYAHLTTAEQFRNDDNLIIGRRIFAPAKSWVKPTLTCARLAYSAFRWTRLRHHLRLLQVLRPTGSLMAAGILSVLDFACHFEGPSDNYCSRYL